MRWGLPRIIRVDNGSPWGSASDLPPDFAQWLIGLGVEMLWNPPHSPQHNGVVERGQGVAKRWAEPHQCGSAAELQQRLDREDRVQREEYPALDGRTRSEAFPGLAHSGRRYSAAWEREHWSWPLVCEHLSRYVAERRIDHSGKIGLYGHKLYIGTRHKGLQVYVQFDPLSQEWVASDKAGRQLYRSLSTILTEHRVRRLQVSTPLP